MFLFTPGYVIPKSLSVFLVFVIIANLALVSMIFRVAPAHAVLGFGDVVFDPASLVQSVIDAAWAAGKWAYEKAVDLKDAAYKVWDQFKSSDGVVAETVSSLLLVMMHQVLAKLTNDIVAWINGGGKGEIRALQDPGKFLLDALDEAGGVLAGQILNVDPATLCNPDFFQVNLKAAFAGPYSVPTFDEKVACTFTGAAEGLKKFTENFTNGGWVSFTEISRKENNPLGQMLILDEELAKVSAEKEKEKEAKITSNGYLPQENCTVTKTPAKLYASGGGSAVGYDPSGFIGKPLEEVMKQTAASYPAGSVDAFKTLWTSLGGEFKCKVVTPAEQISSLANKALQAPLNRLEEALNGLTSKLGTGAGSVLKPYVLAIASAGLNLLVNKGVGLINNTLASAKKSGSTQRQSTKSLQENTELAASASTLVGSVDSFRSSLTNVKRDFSAFLSVASEAASSMSVLGNIPINRVEAQIRGITWPTGFSQNCPPGYFNTGVGHATCNSTATAPGATYTVQPGRMFYEEAQWCGAYAQKISVPTGVDRMVTNVAPIGGTAVDISLLGGNCPVLTYFTPGTETEVTVAGDCTDAEWVRYNIETSFFTTFEMATRVVAYDDTEDGVADRFVRQNIVGADTNNDGVPNGPIPGLDPYYVNFRETLASTKDSNHNAHIDTLDITTPAGLKEIFEMRPNYSNSFVGSGSHLRQGLAGASMANGMIFGGYNQFGYNHLVMNTSGTVIGTQPIGITGAAAVYYPPNGLIYIFGGSNSAQSFNTIWELNPSNFSVRSMTAHLPAPAAGLSAVYYPPTERIYLFGGSNDGIVSDQILEYNQITDTLVTKRAELSSPLTNTAAVTAGSRIYIFGGRTDSGYSSSAILEYNPAAIDDSGAIAEKRAVIEPRNSLVAAVPSGTTTRVRLYGGQNEYTILETAEEYNITTDSISYLAPLNEGITKAVITKTGATDIIPGGIKPALTGTSNAKIFPQGDIYYAPSAIEAIIYTDPVWLKYFSPSIEGATATLLNTKRSVAYDDFSASIPNPLISSKENTNSNYVWLTPSLFPELYEQMQDRLEKMRIINGYNYPVTKTKNYRSSLADQLGSTPDDNPYDNSTNNPRYFDNDIDDDGVIEEDLKEWEGYKGSVTDVLARYSDVTAEYQTLFSGVSDENALEGVDPTLTTLSPQETNLKLALIGQRCPILAPSDVSSPALIEKCPQYDSGTGPEYNMAQRFVFEPNDVGANPTGLTTGFATNPITDKQSSALAGLLNLDEMTSQLRSLSPDKNIIKLIRMRQILEQLQVSPRPIPIPGKADTFITPSSLSGVDIIQISLPGYENIEAYLNNTTTKNLDIQTLITAYGYTNAKEAYPEISGHLDEIFPTITGQVLDKVKEIFLKRISEQVEEARGNAQHRLQRFIEYAKDLNSLVKLEVTKERGDQFLGISGANVLRISEESSIIQLNSENMYTAPGKIDAMLSRAQTRLTDEERKGIIGAGVYKIRSLASFSGVDINSSEFKAALEQYSVQKGETASEKNADLDNRVRSVLRDVYMYYTGIFSQTDETISASKRSIIPTCGINPAEGYYCSLTIAGADNNPLVIYKDARTKLAELTEDFTLMTEEVSAVKTEYEMLFTTTSTQKQSLESFVALLSTIAKDYAVANKCLGATTASRMPIDSANLWLPSSGQSAFYAKEMGPTIAGIITKTSIIASRAPVLWGSLVFPGLDLLIGVIAWLWNDDDEANENANRAEDAKSATTTAACADGVTNFNKHLAELADSFLCNQINLDKAI